MIIKDQNEIEEVLYEPNPIQEKSLNQSMINRITILFIILIYGFVGLFIVEFIFNILKFILNDKTMAIITFFIIVSFCSLYILNYMSSVTLMFIDKRTKSIVIDYKFEYKRKMKKEILKFSDIKEIKLQEFDNAEYGIYTTEHLVKKEENWFGFNKKTQLNVPFEKGVEIARAIGVDCRHVDNDKKSTMLYEAKMP